ncbi:expressed protein localized to the inner membrane of the chloroplast [Striga hermonthica]|uniref:Expressed protein localized to the inner membrane of the chloroplast n=1 Tax=Striga hermonthica TaxID=68872 RepID=A0A9N7NPV0_STRHE|nr:expressed protein localized to the inner membrane of the chloroplast [Striga hermonthica]
MAALSSSVVISKSPSISLSSGSFFKSADQCVGPTSLVFSSQGIKRSSAKNRTLVVKASYSDGGRPNTAGIFVGGFVLGGIVVGALGCVYAPQISKALTGADTKELMRKLPKFIYDEEKALEKQRKKLSEKIEQLNLAIDNISNQLMTGETTNGSAVISSDVEAVI